MHQDARLRGGHLTLVLGASVLALSLTACKTSTVVEVVPRLQLARCVTGQAFVGGDAEQDSSGRVGALAVTTNRDSVCDQAVPMAGSNWAYLYARTRLWYYDGVYVMCGEAENVLLPGSSESQVGAVHYQWCGARPYRTEGYHEVALVPSNQMASSHTYTDFESNS